MSNPLDDLTPSQRSGDAPVMWIDSEQGRIPVYLTKPWETTGPGVRIDPQHKLHGDGGRKT